VRSMKEAGLCRWEGVGKGGTSIPLSRAISFLEVARRGFGAKPKEGKRGKSSEVFTKM